MWIRLLVILLMVPMIALAGEQPSPMTGSHPLIGRIWRPADQRFLSPEDAVSAALAVDVVLLGETHDNPDSHALQAWMLRRLIAGGKRPLVAFEMLDPGQGGKLSEWLAAHPGDADGVGAAVEWEKAGWEWPFYRPIVAAGVAAGVPMAAANLSREDTRAVAKGEAPELMARLGLNAPLDPETKAGLESDVREGHCNMLPESALGAMVAVQRARDASMARALGKSGDAVLIAGTGHARRDRGVPSWLPGRAMLAVAFLEVVDEKTGPAAYAEAFGSEALPFDLVWFTPRADRPDPCEQLREHMKTKGG